MFRIAICDEDNKGSELIESAIIYFENHCFLEIETEVFSSEESLCKHINHNYHYHFDLIFLNFELSAKNGFQVVKRIIDNLNDQSTKIIFVSARSYYEYEVFDILPMLPMLFIPKPLSPEKIIKSVQLALKVFETKNNVFWYKRNYEKVRAARPPNTGVYPYSLYVIAA